MFSNLKYFRDDFFWKQTIFILGLPRSGKSLLLEIIGSFRDVVFSEEPFDLTLIATKSRNWLNSQNHYIDFQDSYFSLLSNLFSELSLGRNMNFRVDDKSYIYNFKSKEEILKLHSLPRRRDLIYKLNENKRGGHFVIVMNEVQECLTFLTEKVPAPFIIFVDRDPIDVASEIEEKKWLSDEHLSSQVDMTPAYRNVGFKGANKIFVPANINQSDTDLFLSLDDFNRSLMYSVLLRFEYILALKDFSQNSLILSLDDILRDPFNVANKLCSLLKMDYGDKTDTNMQRISSYHLSNRALVNKLDLNLLKYFRDNNIPVSDRVHGLL